MQMVCNFNPFDTGWLSKYAISLAGIVEDAGDNFLLYPKFHCELNWIKYCWGGCKHFSRKHCNYALARELRLEARIRREQNANFIAGGRIAGGRPSYS